MKKKKSSENNLNLICSIYIKSYCLIYHSTKILTLYSFEVSSQLTPPMPVWPSN